MRDGGGQLIAESWNGEFKTPEIVTEIDKIEFLAGFDLRGEGGIKVSKRDMLAGESRDRRRRRVHRALTRFAEQERGVFAKGSGVWKVDPSCEEMEKLLNHFEDLLKKDRDGDRYGPGERFVDLVFDEPELVLGDAPHLFSEFSELREEFIHRIWYSEPPSRFKGQSKAEEIMEIMAEICGTEGSAHITEIRDRASLIGDAEGEYGYSKDDVDGAITLLLSSDSITKIGEDEYEIKKDIDRKAAIAFRLEQERVRHESQLRTAEEIEGKMLEDTEKAWEQAEAAWASAAREIEAKTTLGRRHLPYWFNNAFPTESADIGLNMHLESDKNKLDEWFSGFYEDLAVDREKMSEMKIGNQLQSVFEKEVKKGHWPMKSMKQKATEGEIPLVKWKIHELVMDILWSNYQAESDEATLESSESEDSQYKAPGYLPTSQITSGLKSKYGVEKSDGRISQVLGDLCGLGVLKSEKVEGGRGKKYKLTTKGKVMMKSAEKAMSGRFSITSSGDIVAAT